MAVPIVAAVVTVSDSGFAGARDDTSGEVLEQLLRDLGAESVARALVPDDAETIAAQLRRFADATDVNLILTTGGTGFTSRDVTPEATRAVIEREAPGIAEAMRFISLRQTPRAMLSRGVSGLRGRTLIINMPGSPRACREQFEIIREALPHGIEKLLDSGGDCARPDEPPRPSAPPRPDQAPRR
jgi:molybdopterin adenylyltransferase